MDRFPYLYLHYFCGSRTPADQMRPEMKRTRNARAAGSVQCDWPSVRNRGFPANGHERRLMSQGHGERGGWGDFDFDFGRRVLSYVPVVRLPTLSCYLCSHATFVSLADA